MTDRSRRLPFRSQALLAAGVAAAIGMVLAGAGSAGFLARLELATYDVAAFLVAPDRAPDGIVIVERRDDELFALDDDTLSIVLDTLLNRGARIVGIDLIRDQPRGANPGKLATQVRDDRRIVLIADPTQGLWPWPVPSAERAAFARSRRLVTAQVPKDADGISRRGLRYSRSSGMWSLAAAVTVGESPRPDSSADNVLGAPYGFRSEAGVLLSPIGDLTRFPRLGLSAVLGRHRTEADASALDRLRGSAVLIGAADSSLLDRHQVLFSRFDHPAGLPGVYLHALGAATLAGIQARQAPAIRTIPMAAWVAIIAGLVLFGSALGVGSQLRWLLPAAALLLLGLFAAELVALGQSSWLPLGAPAAALALAATGGAVVRGAAERRQRALTNQLFERFVTPALADEMWRHRQTILRGGRPMPVELFVTVLFADLRDSVGLAERESPVELLETLTDLTASLAECVVAHGGLVNDYAGDALMAEFGVPLPRTTNEARAADARSALACAQLMAVRVADLNRRREPARRPLLVRVGIHSGPAIAGVVGGGERLKYTVVGDTVNTTARIQTMQSDRLPEPAPVRILLSSATKELLGPDARTSSLGLVSLPGRSEPIEVHVACG